MSNYLDPSQDVLQAMDDLFNAIGFEVTEKEGKQFYRKKSNEHI